MQAIGGFGRILIIGVTVVVLALVGVHVYNATRLDIGGLRASAETILERAREISERARPEYEELAASSHASRSSTACSPRSSISP